MKAILCACVAADHATPPHFSCTLTLFACVVGFSLEHMNILREVMKINEALRCCVPMYLCIFSSYRWLSESVNPVVPALYLYKVFKIPKRKNQFPSKNKKSI